MPSTIKDGNHLMIGNTELNNIPGKCWSDVSRWQLFRADGLRANHTENTANRSITEFKQL